MTQSSPIRLSKRCYLTSGRWVLPSEVVGSFDGLANPRIRVTLTYLDWPVPAEDTAEFLVSDVPKDGNYLIPNVAFESSTLPPETAPHERFEFCDP